MDNLITLADTMSQAGAILADEDGDAPKASTSFLSAIALGSVSAGKSAVLNTIIGHPVLPTGENGATRAPIIIDMERDKSGRPGGLAVVLEGRTQNVSASDVRHSLQGRLKSVSSSKSRGDGIRLTLRSNSGPPLKLIDLPGIDSRGSLDDSPAHDLAANNDTILLVVIAATSCRDVAVNRALKLAQELDSDGSRTVGVISKVDQAASDPRSLAAVNALISGQGPSNTQDIPWVALIGQSVSIAAAHSSPEDSLDTAWKAEMESLKTILKGAPSAKLGRIALLETLASKIQSRLKQRIPNLLSGLEGKSHMVAEELARLGELRVTSSEGNVAVALELCREFEDKFLAHINTGEGQGWKIVASFEGVLPKRMKGLPLDQMFEISSIKKLVLEADGYQPYLLSPEKGLRALIKKALELAKEPAKSCVDEVHRVLVDIVSASASGTPGLSRYPPLKREIVSIASAALEEYRVEAKKMAVALVDMERVFIPPQHFIRLVQRRMERAQKLDTLQGAQTKKAQVAEQSLLSKVGVSIMKRSRFALIGLSDVQATALISTKKEDTKVEEPKKDSPPVLQTVGDNSAGYLYKKSDKNEWVKRWFVLNEKTGKLAYTKKPEERSFRGVIPLEECMLEDGPEETGAEEANGKSSKSKSSSNGTAEKEDPMASLIFRVSHKVAYKTVLKAEHSVHLRAENMAEKLEWMSKIRACIESSSQGEPDMSTVLRRPSDPEEDLRLMAQEVRDYVEAVLNSLAANVPKAVVLCQVERAKDAMLNQLYSSISSMATARIQELLMEDQEVKTRRERAHKQSAALAKLTKTLGLHEARAAVVSTDDSNYSFSLVAADSKSDGGLPGAEDWRVAFQEAGSRSSHSQSPSRSSRNESPMHGRSSRSIGSENGDVGASRRTPARTPPPPPPGGGMYKY
uniref:dynamin GTPase n=1 Tax=Physcomitrium patens TaxID=3218 RepID=A9U1V2_PHYPA